MPVFRGAPLPDERTLAELNIQKESTLELRLCQSLAPNAVPVLGSGLILVLAVSLFFVGAIRSRLPGRKGTVAHSLRH